jgi:hypothetical protein
MYITSSYIGHDFLRSAYTAKYEAEGKTFQLFVVDAKSPEGAKETLAAYLANEGSVLIKDRYNGEIPLVRKGSYLVGIYSENGDALSSASALLKEVAGKLN